MITPYEGPEARDDKATGLWQNLAKKLNLRAPNVRQASADELKIQRLSDGLQTHGKAPVRRGMVKVAGLTKVSAPQHLAESVFDNLIAMHVRAEAELSQTERVKAVDFLSRIADQAEGVKGKVADCDQGDAKVADLCGEIGAKADAVIGAVTQLRDKAGDMSVAQAEAISNAFLLINDAANYLGKKGAEAPVGAPSMPEIELLDGGLPEMPPSEETPSPASAIAGHIPAFVRRAMDEAYDDMRCVHTKMLLIESMLNEIISDLNVNTMMTPGMSPTGMPPTTELDGPDTPEVMRAESEEQAAAKGAEAGLKGAVKTAASGDPGDTEPGNSVYKDLNKCRDCVWFESDHTHETYRDKCKNCVHAKLDGTTEHWWPRSQQMIIWAPQWGAPEALEKKKAFQDTLSLRQAAPDQAQSIAREIVGKKDNSCARCGHPEDEHWEDGCNVERTEGVGEDTPLEDSYCKCTGFKSKGKKASAVFLGKVFIDTFRNPLIASQMGTLARGIVAEVESLTGVAMARDSKDGNLIIAYPVIEQVAKGEKAKIRELRTQLDGEKDPVKIKQLHDAIEALHDRITKDKERKQQRREDRQERREKQQTEWDKQHANIPAKSEVEANLTGSLCLADALQWPSGSPGLAPGESFPVCPKCKKEHAQNVPCAGAPAAPSAPALTQASVVGTLTSRRSL